MNLSKFFCRAASHFARRYHFSGFYVRPHVQQPAAFSLLPVLTIVESNHKSSTAAVARRLSTWPLPAARAHALFQRAVRRETLRIPYLL